MNYRHMVKHLDRAFALNFPENYKVVNIKRRHLFSTFIEYQIELSIEDFDWLIHEVESSNSWTQFSTLIKTKEKGYECIYEKKWERFIKLDDTGPITCGPVPFAGAKISEKNKPFVLVFMYEQ